MTTMLLDDSSVRALTEHGIHFDTELKGFGVRVQPGVHGVKKTWIVMYRLKGRQHRKKLADVQKLSAKAARQLATEKLAMVVLRQDPFVQEKADLAARSDKLLSVIQQYLAHMERQLENDKRRPVTVNNARLYLARGDYFRPLHATPINDITRQAVAIRLRAIIDKHSANTASRARSNLSSFFAWAVGEAIADQNPVIGTNDPGSNPPRKRVLSNDELCAVWNACENAGEYGKIVRLLMLSGCRRSEIGKLCWSWLKNDTTTMTIPATLTKNHNEHMLPITSLMRSIIDGIEHMVGRDQLFGVRAGGFSKWGTKLDVSFAEPWTLHDIRRSVATGMANIGIQPHVIEAVLNHVSGHKAGVAGIYNRSTYAIEMKQALAMWSDHIASIVTGSERKVIPMQRA